MAGAAMGSAGAPGNDIWKQAANCLSDDDRAQLNFCRSDKLGILSDLLAITEKEKQRCEKGRISFRRKSGEKVFMRDLFAKLIKWIEHFKQVGDAAVQYGPAHASLPWAGIRSLVEIAVSNFNAAELILEHITLLVEMISRSAVLEQLFLPGPSPSEIQVCSFVRPAIPRETVHV